MTHPKPAPGSNLPMFYSSPRPLDRAKDTNLKVSRPTHFRFAAKTNALPLVIDEFPMAAAYYPIVFSDESVPIPAAVVGLRNDSNLFVDSQGQWLADAYLPAYVRRYPFILMDDPEHNQFVLCIDEASEMLGREDGYPLFQNGEPSEFTKSVMELCTVLRKQGDATDAFVKALKERNLLVPNDTKIEMCPGTHLQLSGFLVIDPQKFHTVPANVFLEWRKNGWMSLFDAHLLSSQRWQSLADLMHTRRS